MQNLTNEFCELRKQYIDAKFMTMNPMQKKAIYNVDGPVLVLAGAGSGKTTTIIGRIIYMVMFGHAYYSTETTFPVTEGDIKELKSVLSGTGSISEHLKSMLQVKPVSPQNIMAVTFTNKAAGEMKKRLESKLGKDMAEKVYAKTFHSACVGILREYAMFVGFKRDFTIYDEKDCKSVLKDIYKANGIKEKELHKDDVLNHISIWKDKMITPDMAISQSTISSYNTVAHLYKEYQERLKNANAMDFDDLIGNTIQLLKEHPDIQAELQKKIQYIMVDEYQDTNASQHELLSLLVSPEHNICVVGDDDQSIYSFRGADVDNILNFPQEFDGTHKQCLCVVNEKEEAKAIYTAIENGRCKNLYCLTTDITPYDREKLLRQIRQNLKDDEPCIVISTSLIESGVDVDFPYGYRELYGLDSILQTAGRVNRNGLRDCGNSTLFVFDGPQEEYRALRNGTSRGCNESDNKKSITRGILQKYDVDSPKAIHEYFSRLYGYKGDGLDKFDIVKMASSKLIPFQDISQKFKIIDEDTVTVIISQTAEASELVGKIRNQTATKDDIRKAGKYAVSVKRNKYDKYLAASAEVLTTKIYDDTEEPDICSLVDMGLYTGIGIIFDAPAA